MDREHPSYCRKEKEIAEIHTELRIVKKAVIGNGDGLMVTVPKLAQSVDTLNTNVLRNNTLTSGVLRFKDEMEGRDIGKAEIRKGNRWVIGILVSVLVAMFGTLMFLIDKLANIIP